MSASTRSAWASAVLVAAALGLPALAKESSVPKAERDTRGREDVPDPPYRVHHQGSFRALVTNWGQIGSRPGTTTPGSQEPSFEWPTQSVIEYLWTAGLWFGARQFGERRVTTTEFENEVRSGPELWQTHEGAPGGARQPSPQADDDADGRTDEDRRDGYDNDGDGRIDEDFAAISEQMYFGVFDDGDAPKGEHRPLRVEIEQSTFAWSDPRIDDLLGIEWLIVNQGFEPLDFPRIGLFADCDIGARAGEQVAEDDRAGFWDGNVEAELGGPVHTVRVSMGYMFDAAPSNPVPGWIGLVPLGTESRHGNLPGSAIRNYRAYSGRRSWDFGGDPTNDEERYATLDGTDPFPLPPPDATGFRPAQLTTRSEDYRVLLALDGPETVEPGDSLRASFAIVIGAGFEELKLNAARAVLLHANDWRVEGPLAVALQDLEAVATPQGIQLTWRVGDAGDVHAARVLRREGDELLREHAVLPASRRMSFEDTDVVAGHTYIYRIDLETHAGTQIRGREITVRFDGELPGRASLGVPRTRADGTVEIEYRIARSGPFELTLFDARGRTAAPIASGATTPGTYVRVWDGRTESGARLGRGVYFLRLESAGRSVTRKLVRAD